MKEEGESMSDLGGVLEMPVNTPMMRQYQEIKGEHQDSILFFRMGDFYEMFFEDAVEVSGLLNLTLTKRQGIPMCGIPYHAVENYLNRLLQLDKRVAICEQVEEPRKGKGLARREVVEIVSPGIVLQEGFLDRQRGNYLVSFGLIGKDLGMGILDFSTGEFYAAGFFCESDAMRREILQRELLLIKPRELLLMEELHNAYPEEFWGNILVNRLPAWYFQPESAEKKLCEFFGVQSLKGFGFAESSGKKWSGHTASGALRGAAWVILEYLAQSQKKSESLSHVRKLSPLNRSQQLQLDSAALRNLEIFQNFRDGGKSFTLFEVLHDCKSSLGSRCLWRWLSQPLKNCGAIRGRLDRVETLLEHSEMRSGLRRYLGELADVERLMGRVTNQKNNARDLVSLRASLVYIEKIYRLIRGNELLAALFTTDRLGASWLDELAGLRGFLDRAIGENPPAVIHDGKMIAPGYHSGLDELRNLLDQRKQVLNSYLEEEQQKNQLGALKIKYNRIIGYYFELPKGQASRVPDYFIRRQSLVNAERFTTEALAELEAKLSNAGEEIIALERRLFEEISRKVCPFSPLILSLGSVLAQLDVLANFAELAQRQGYCKPEVLPVGQGKLEIVRGRHPVVEFYVHDDQFVSNDLTLDRDRFFALVTGPNMAGKSTYLRQNALIVLMAQCGCFVPADRAVISVVDRIFCRVGASDNLSRGESTFMVEMQETARILNEASSESLVIMDEIGRGTSTRDGLAIAWSICEYILGKVQCYTLFATHYHELSALDSHFLKKLSLAVNDEGETIQFLRRVEEGTAKSSYGIHVALLAGIPLEVIQRAEALLGELSVSVGMDAVPLAPLTDLSEKSLFPEEAGSPLKKQSRGKPAGPRKKTGAENLLFTEETSPNGESLIKELRDLNLVQVTAIEALEILISWSRKYGGN